MKRSLEGGTVQQLLNAVEEFLSYHHRIAPDTRQADSDTEVKANFTERLQALVNALKEEEGLT